MSPTANFNPLAIVRERERERERERGIFPLIYIFQDEFVDYLKSSI